MHSQLLNKNLTITTITFSTLVNIHKSKVHVPNMQLASVGYTYVTKIFSTNVDKTSSTRFFLMGKPPLGTIYKAYDVTKQIQLSSQAKNL